MSQKHLVQHGTFHVTTNTKNHMPWCVASGIPTIIIDNMVMTKNLQKATLHAFCILPDDVHIILSTGVLGLSNFMHSFKRNTMRDIRQISHRGGYEPPLRGDDGAMIAWQKSFYDERIRDARQLSATFGYVLGNAMHHDLVSVQEAWPWSSIHFQNIIDPMEPWLE